MTVPGLAPDKLALADVGIDFLDEAFGDHRLHHLGGGASAQGTGKRQDIVTVALSGGAENYGLRVGELGHGVVSLD